MCYFYMKSNSNKAELPKFNTRVFVGERPKTSVFLFPFEVFFLVKNDPEAKH